MRTEGSDSRNSSLDVEEMCISSGEKNRLF